MKKLRTAILAIAYVGSLISLIYIPTFTYEAFSGYRAMYWGNFSILELERMFLRKHDPAIVVAWGTFIVRFLAIWVVAGIAFLALRRIEKKRMKSF